MTTSVTTSFLTLSVARLLHVFNMRDPRAGVFRNEVTTNPVIWGALDLCLGLLLLAVYLLPLADVLGVAAPGWREWCLIVGAALIPLIAGQIYLAVAARGSR